MRWTHWGLAVLLAAISCGGDDDDGGGTGGSSNAGSGGGSSGAPSSGGATASGGGSASGGSPSGGAGAGAAASGSGSGGSAGAVGQAGAGGSGAAPATSCTLDSQCELIDNCCECSAVPSGTVAESCQRQCVVHECRQQGVLGARCLRERCVPLYDCDQSHVICGAPTPSCADDELPSIRNGCYGECVPRERCAPSD